VSGTPIQLDPSRGIASRPQYLLFQRELRSDAFFVLPNDWALPSDLAANPFARGPFDLAITRVFPRVNIFGGSVGYHLKPEQFPGAWLLQGFFMLNLRTRHTKSSRSSSSAGLSA
jgi:hypothetical protein